MNKNYILKGKQFETLADAVEYADYLTETQIDNAIDEEFDNVILAGKSYKTSELMYEVNYDEYRLRKEIFLNNLINSIEDVYEND